MLLLPCVLAVIFNFLRFDARIIASSNALNCNYYSYGFNEVCYTVLDECGRFEFTSFV